MIKYLWLIIFLAPWCNNNLSSQVRGQIIDAKTKQPLAGANIYTNRGVGVAVADKSCPARSGRPPAAGITPAARTGRRTAPSIFRRLPWWDGTTS